MPNLRSQRCDSKGIFVESSGGDNVTISSEEILDYYDSQSGSPAEKRSLTRIHFKEVIQEAIGSENVAMDEMDFDFDETTGEPTSLIFGDLT